MRTSRAIALGVLGVAACAIVVAAVTGIPAGFLLNIVQKRVEADSGVRLSGNAKLAIWPLSLRIDNVNVTERDSRAQPLLSADSIRLSIPVSSLLRGSPQVTDATITRPVLRVSFDRDAADRQTPNRSADSRLSSGQAEFFPRRLTAEDASIVLSDRTRKEARFDHVGATVDVTEADGRSDLVAIVKWQDHTLRVQTSAPSGSIEGRAFPIKISHESPGSAAIAMSAEGKAGGSTFSLNSIEGRIGEDKFDGWASVRFSRIPSVTADVHFHHLTVPPLWPARSDTAVTTPWSDEAIDLDALNFFDANAKISATQFTFDRFQAGPVTTETVIEKGALTASLVEAQVNDGRASGRLSVDAAQPAPQWHLQLDLADVRAGPIVSSFTGSNLVEGLMRSKMELSGSGNSARQIVYSLGGSIDVELKDGEIPGINIADMVRTLAAQTLKGWQNKGVEKTDFTALNASFRVEGGSAETESIRLLGPFVRVTGKGKIDLAQKTLNLKFEPKVVLSMQGQGSTDDPVGLGVPVIVEGAWQEPRIYPDIAGIFDNPDDAFAKLNSLSGGIFGGKDGKSGGMFDSLGQSIDRLLGGDAGAKQGGGASQPSTEGGKPNETPRQPSDIIKELFGR